LEAESLDEGALADPGHAGDADAVRPAGLREEFCQKRLGILPIVGSVRLDESDRPSESRPVVFANSAKQFVDVVGRFHDPSFASII